MESSEEKFETKNELSVLSDFKQKYLKKQNDISKYKQTRNLFYIFAALGFLLFLPALLSIGLYLDLLFSSSKLSVILNNQGLLLMAVIGPIELILFLMIFRSYRKFEELKSEHINPVYSEIASAIEHYQNNQFDKTLESLKTVVNSISSPFILKSDRLNELKDYVDALEDRKQENELQITLKKSFGSTMYIICQEILLDEESLSEITEEIRPEKTDSGHLKTLFRDIIPASKIKDVVYSYALNEFWLSVAAVLILGISTYLLIGKDIGMIVTISLITIFTAYHSRNR